MNILYLFLFIVNGLLCAVFTDSPLTAIIFAVSAIMNLAFFIVEDIKSHINKLK